MARTLYLTPRSPYARKVRVLLMEKALAFEPSWVDLAARSEAFVAVSPLGKVPVLVDDDVVVFDSTVIAEYLEDRYPEVPMFGLGWRERLAHRAVEELCDTIADQAVAGWQARTRGDATAETRALGLAERALEEVERRVSSGWPSDFGLADVALVSALGYLELRHGRALPERFPRTLAHAAGYAARPSVAETVPRL